MSEKSSTKPKKNTTESTKNSTESPKTSTKSTENTTESTKNSTESPKNSTESTTNSNESIESTTKSSKESKLKVNIHDGDWKIAVGSSIMYYSAKENKWYCTECDETFISRSQSGAHKRNVHGDNTTDDVEPENEDKPENEKIDRTQSTKFREKIFGRSIESEKGIRDTGDLALQINIEEESRLVSQLIKNPYVTFTFAKLKDERKIYPDWTLADFLREGALYLCKKLGCQIEFNFDIDLLKQDPEFGEIAIKINRAWEEFDAEKALLNSGVKERKQ